MTVRNRTTITEKAESFHFRYYRNLRYFFQQKNVEVKGSTESCAPPSPPMDRGYHHERNHGDIIRTDEMEDMSENTALPSLTSR